MKLPNLSVRKLFRTMYSKIGAYLFNCLTANPFLTFGWVIICLTCGLIIANAVSLQSGPHPAPLFRSPPDTANSGPNALQNNGREPPKNSVHKLVQDVQIALLQNGYYEGEIDGRIGSKTKEAIEHFQKENNLPVDTKITGVLLAQIYTIGRGKVTSDDHLSENYILTLQEALANLGFGPVKITGKLSNETKEAIARFEQNRGLPVTGEPSIAVLDELRNIGGLSN